MATYGENYPGWSNTEIGIYESITEYTAAYDDDEGKALFHAAYFELDRDWDDIKAIRAEVEQYFLEEYEIDIEEDFDWDDWRDWYDSQ
jgi:hypothetical protein